MGKTLRPGDPDDLYLHDTGDQRLPDRGEADEGGQIETGRPRFFTDDTA